MGTSAGSAVAKPSSARPSRYGRFPAAIIALIGSPVACPGADRLCWTAVNEDGERVIRRSALDGAGAEDFVPSSGSAPPSFRRGDSNGDASLDLADPVSTLGALFLGAASPPCADAADTNDDGAIDIADAVAALTHLFLGGFEIPPPGPSECGPDPLEPDGLGCELYSVCLP